MKPFLSPFATMPQIEEIKKNLHKRDGFYELVGCLDYAKAHLMYGIGQEFKHKILISYDEVHGKQLYEQYKCFQEDVLFFPSKDLLFYQSNVHGNIIAKDRMKVIQKVLSKDDFTIITTIDALFNPMIPKECYNKAILTLEVGKEYDFQEVQKKLIALGYENVTQVEHGGEYSVRGGIIDLFPLTSELPVRIEFWGDEIDSIRLFEGDSQKSIAQVEEIVVFPGLELIIEKNRLHQGLEEMQKDAKKLWEMFRKEGKTKEAHQILSSTKDLAQEVLDWGMCQELEAHMPYFTEEIVSFLSYLPKDTFLVLEEGNYIYQRGTQLDEEVKSSMERRKNMGYLLPKEETGILSFKVILEELQQLGGLFLSTLDGGAGKYFPVEKRYYIKIRSVTSYNKQIGILKKELKNYIKEGYGIILLASQFSKGKRMSAQLREDGFSAIALEECKRELFPGEILVMQGILEKGFEYPEGKFVILTERDIFGGQAQRKKKKRIYEGEKISGFSDLKVGDYVVHENYGLGIYQGIEQIETNRVLKDYVKITYAKGDNLYILATQLDVLQKYGDKEGKRPKLNRLDSKEWIATKGKVQKAVGQVAKDLVELYAHRQQQDGFVYGEDTVWQEEFEENFPYEETESQLLAIQAVKQDMMSKKIMDRLICGDVGYGKTEIAIRAAFKAVQENKQVVYLVPTTILAQQHYKNFVERMESYPVTVRLMCRFNSAKEQKETIAGLKKGQVDIVIGTHRLLSKDITYKDLGLLIVDEEQRFGVNHKEKIKQLKKNVDVLSLSATPIPRTLHMSLIGIRDMSVLDEAPMERMPVQTFVFEYNEELMREAILRELSRGGQVYYVFNRVRGIQDMAATIEQLVPEATVAYIHGQMSETALEKLMYQFVNGEIDILVSTTIIEIGLDIANVNTIMIHDADHFGLSQLYQLRGRVGRSNRMAYAFFMYRRDKVLKEVAQKRLAAIKEFTDLGSGFKIAMRDLEIRGAGNLLGEEQHGHMAAVGYDLYCKMLNEAVKEEKGIPRQEQFETLVDIDMDAFLPASYMPGELQRLDTYKRIAQLETVEEREEMLDELIDRFGEPPKSVLNLLYLAQLRGIAHQCYITEIKEKNGEVRLTLLNTAPLMVEKLQELLGKYSPNIRFIGDKEAPGFVFDTKINSRYKKKDIPQWLEGFLTELKTMIAG